VTANVVGTADFLGGFFGGGGGPDPGPVGGTIPFGGIDIDPCAFLSGVPLRICRAGQSIFTGGDDVGMDEFQATEACPPFFSPDPITGRCRLDLDPGAGTGLPGGGAAAGSGLTRPTQVSRRVLECPRFADGKTGILWMNALTGDVICLPRRTSGRGFGLIRKNKPRKKAFISAAQKKSLDNIKSVQGKAKKFAEDAGFACKKR